MKRRRTGAVRGGLPDLPRGLRFSALPSLRNPLVQVWLADGTPLEFDRIERKVSRDDLAAEGDRLKGHYGLEPEDIFGKSDTAEGTLDALFKAARMVLEKDGHHITIMFYFKGKTMLHLTELRPAEHGQKYLMMRNAAHDLVRKRADAVIIIGEVWRAPYLSSNPFRRAVDAPEREEMLVADLVRKTGEPVQLSARMVRKDGRVTAEETHIQRGGAHSFSRPFTRRGASDSSCVDEAGAGDARC